jgi:hypothetical protein|tara:strand:- start:127 stop:480 length:354 start_codon:yes stop_codon:yes gene_type:complete
MEFSFETTLDVTSVIVNEDSTTLCYEGMAGDYGRVFATHTLTGSNASKDTGTFKGDGRIITEDGSMISVNLVGIWRRQGEKVKIFSLDNVVNGDQNYVELEVDVFEKKAYVKVYALN